jgi:pimeloyl-ACP methyl ester carboxylesterase
MMASAAPAGAIAAQRAMLARDDSTRSLAAIAVPTLVVAGAEDAIIPAAEQRAMADAIPGARWAEIPGAGHVAPFERPGAFNLAVAELLATLG